MTKNAHVDITSNGDQNNAGVSHAIGKLKRWQKRAAMSVLRAIEKKQELARGTGQSSSGMQILHSGTTTVAGLQGSVEPVVAKSGAKKTADKGKRPLTDAQTNVPRANTLGEPTKRVENPVPSQSNITDMEAAHLLLDLGRNQVPGSTRAEGDDDIEAAAKLLLTVCEGFRSRHQEGDRRTASSVSELPPGSVRGKKRRRLR